MDKIEKWTTTVEYIDTETGEIIRKQLAKDEYIVIKKYKKYKIEERNGKKYGITVWTNECEPNKQVKLF